MKKNRNERPPYLKDVYILPNSSRKEAEERIKELEKRAKKLREMWIIFTTRRVPKR